MKTHIAAVAMAALSVLSSGSALAQGDAQKKELATRIVTLQQGADMDQLAAQLTGAAVGPMLAKWTPRLQSDVPESRRKEVADRLNVELNKYREETQAIIKATATKASNETLVPAYVERFNEDELRKLAAFFDDPVIKKYQVALPDMLNGLVRQMVDLSRADVEQRTAAFDEAAARIVGSEAGKKSSAPAKKK